MLTVLLLLQFTCINLHAQERTITGRLTDTDGSAMPGVSIVIKGTAIGTVTDVDGNYTIKAPIGSTLVFSFVGMQTREVLVTDSNGQSPSNKKTPATNQQLRTLNSHNWLYLDSESKKDAIGVATLTDKTPRYKTNSTLSPTTIRAIKRFGNQYLIRMDTDPYRQKGFGLQFTTSISFDRINRLPSLQNKYAQGRPIAGNSQWVGPDQQEMFSWGPLVRTLEYDGSNYPYDQRGMLVQTGTGNGIPASTFKATDFFNTGISTTTEILFAKPTSNSGIFLFDFENRNRSGVIPNSDYRKINLRARLEEFQLSRHIKFSTAITYNHSAGDLLARGANLTTIMGSVYRTPATFDNTNLMSEKNALNSPAAYRLSDGTVRASAPGLSDNPYGLVNSLPDNDEQQRWLAMLNVSYRPQNRFTVNLNATFDQQNNNSQYGTPPGYAPYTSGRLTNRQDDQLYLDGNLTAGYTHYQNGNELKFNLSYQPQYTQRSLTRLDGYHFSDAELFNHPEQADSIINRDRIISRSTHEITFQTNYAYKNWLRLRFSNRNYFSNTVSTSAYTNLFPSLGVSIDFAELVDQYIADQLKVHTNFSRTIREAPLLYSNWSYASTTLPVQQYASFYEIPELFHQQSLVPETEQKFETGLSVHMLSNRLAAGFTYYQSRTNDFIAPVQQLTEYALQNVASITNEGLTISIGYNHYYSYNEFNWGTDLKWSTYNSVVDKLYASSPWIALAGFETAQTVLAPGKPAGAIYGTSYSRNTSGKLLIDNSGFPMEDNNLSMIGNPIPDWMLGWSAFLQYHGVKLSFLFDFKRGGDVWNGTNSVLNYLGRSHATGKLRTTSNYVFDGVDENGNTNSIPVTFADPTKPLSENRWVRYGWDGVGEDYIEDASWFRLSEVMLSYSTPRRSNRIVQEIKCSLVARNLFIVTPYSGVDPSSTLFGAAVGNGLDLFNTPALRSYTMQVTIKI